ncbi:expressed unknown protein [Seminavis robusta]|uniref:Uncharacterized protein n=1 Tax=Seminavis robusta TaxID=568900 RepID=A0A9N8ESL1_9STRA|nr:expressed unknown protein [Seminavis robusta]|eukprot:Sro1525_g279710.1 n/a (164) ;mRNA; f:21099-22485
MFKQLFFIAALIATATATSNRKPIAKDKKMEEQRRLKAPSPTVVQIGDDTLEVMGGMEPKQHWVNGKAGDKLDESKLMSFTIGGYPVRFRQLTDKSFQFKIFLPNDQNIVLKAVKDFMRVDEDAVTDKRPRKCSKKVISPKKMQQQVGCDKATSSASGVEVTL